MEFYTSSKYKRPIRLSEETRRFAYDSLNHKYGLDTDKTPNVDVSHIENYKNLSPLERYNLGVYEIVTKAPLRICDGELISGAATLSDAKDHLFPAAHKDIQRNYLSGVSHFTANFFEVLEIGMEGIRKKAEKSLAAHSADPKKKEFIESCIHCIDCMDIWRKRYITALSEKVGYEKVAENLKHVPFKPARNFYEAVQSVWFCFAFMRLTGVWPGIGRIDVLLGKYLKADLDSGRLTIGEAREILAHFFIKGCEWIDGKVFFSGDAQHYQNIVLSGIDEKGKDVTNEVTMLVLDIVEETGISDFPVTVRINKNTDERFLRRVAEVIRFGGGIVAVYDEDLILESLEQAGYKREEARKFANDGCWEIQIPGKTYFQYIPFDALKLLQNATLNGYKGADYKSFEELLAKYRTDIKEQVKAIFEWSVLNMLQEDRVTFKSTDPCSIVALFEDACIERGLSYKEGGTVYTVVSPHIGGLPDAVNSLYALKKVVFDDKLLTLNEFMKVLDNNWQNEEDLRKHILNDYIYFGNDNDEVDEIAAGLLSDFSDACLEYDGQTPIRFLSGVSTFGRQIEWAPSRSATPFGRKKGEVLSGNMSPTPGTEHSGVSAAIKSYCKADLKKQYTGAALDVGFVPQNMDGENAIAALCGLIKGFVKLGGSFMQIDTVNAEVLTDAQKHPENYQNLSVRVSGWNARFVTMNREWQDMIIARTK